VADVTRGWPFSGRLPVPAERRIATPLTPPGGTFVTTRGQDSIEQDPRDADGTPSLGSVANPRRIRWATRPTA